MKTPKSPFAIFEAALAAERKQQRALLIPAGEDDPDQPQPRHRASRSRPTTIDRVHLQVAPRITAAGAMTAAMEGTNTDAVIQRWVVEMVETGKKPEIHPGIEIVLKLTIGSKALPRELWGDLDTISRRVGVDPGDFIAACIKKSLADDKLGHETPYPWQTKSA